MSEARVAARYARSIFDLAKERDIIDIVKQDSEFFLQACRQSRQFELMLKSPIIPKAKKWHVIKRLFEGRFQPITLAFAHIVLRKNRELVLKEIFQQFDEMYRDNKGIVIANVSTAMPISDSIKEEITAYLKNQTHKTIELQTSIKPELVGGFVLRYEDKLIDASVSSKLKSLKQHLIN